MTPVSKKKREHILTVKNFKKRKCMNCWLWILLLFFCKGNCSNSCSNNSCSNNSCSNNSCSNNNCSNNSCSNNGCGNNSSCNNSSGVIQPRFLEDCGGNALEKPCGKEQTYETFGCQANGVPCPPPVPAAFMR